MRSKSPILLAAALAAPLASAQAAVSDFRLPQEPATQQQPERQGPVAPDVPESRRPAPTPAPTARETEPTPAPEPAITPPPIVVPPQVTAMPSTPASQPTPVATRPAAQPLPAPSDIPAGDATADEPAPLPAPAPAASPPASVAAEGEEVPLWPWALGALLVLGAAGLAAWAWTRRRSSPERAGIPQVERPTLTPSARPLPGPAVAPAPMPAPSAAEPLQVSLQPLRLSLTLMNATLNWRLEVSNRGPAPLTGLTVAADMISAHASMSREEQLSGPRHGPRGAPAQRIERLEPGESRAVEGEFRLPLAQIVPIRQGNAALLVPLARFRVEAEGADPLVRTFAVGQPGNGSNLQPFRLDQGPRVYPSLVQHAFA